MIESYSTIVTKSYFPEFVLFYFSLRSYENKQPLYVLCDSECKRWIETNFEDENIHPVFDPNIEEPDARQGKMDSDTWNIFMTKKMEILAHGLEKHSNCFFLDSDNLFLRKAPELDFKLIGLDVILTPHYMKEEMCRKYGFFNAGNIIVRSKRFLKWWEQNTKNNTRFYDQECLDRAPEEFNTKSLPEIFNFGWWRYFHHPNKSLFPTQLSVENQQLCFEGSSVFNIHTHFHKKEVMYVNFNKLVLERLGTIQTPIMKHIVSLISKIQTSPSEFSGMKFSF